MSESLWLTQEAYDRLKEELEHRSTIKRQEIATKIDNARQEGDLKENGGYHAARDEQAMNETRINQLTNILRDAVVGATPADDGIVEAGMVVTAEIMGSQSTFLLGSRMAGSEDDLEVYSIDAPIGQALNGHKVGETVSYFAPNGREIEVKILDAVPYKG
ncbi:prokaryotic transcription elongation factor, GreA/GreB domain protein [Gleimia coleocanis DSM 15436]|uniref:Transcription elongation factor GreA n=1 Tax=Gleimia coleocanis DSM 15436 TaxID=525245 RepID=C0VZN0_9ACTO|nr:transcription elongation factor GreA [Gleimia coleocanis]EEH64149.1 prokaryotic transcription elongation factor, GreA/GreB domain protein [Gleimia coleocanis DSM 15436]